MPIFKVKSPIKKDGQLYAVGADIDLSTKDAKELAHALVIDVEKTPELAPKAPKTKAEKEAAAQAKKAKDASERAQAEADEAAKAAGDDGKGDDSNDDEPKTENRAVTKEDLAADPELAKAGVKVGDMHDFVVAEAEDDADDL
jgi:hypothetical protein